MLRYFLLLSLILSLFISVFYSMSVTRTGVGDVSRVTAEAIEESSVMEGVTVVSTSGSRKIWSMKSGSMDIASKSVFMHDIEAQLADVDMAISAPEAKYNTASRSLRITGGVVMRGEDYVAKVDELKISSSNGIASAEGEVVIDGSGVRVVGSGLQLTKNDIKVLSDVKAMFY